MQIPSDSTSAGLLQRVLTRAVARAKWGDAGSYGVSAFLDGEVREAMAAFDRAAALLARPPAP